MSERLHPASSARRLDDTVRTAGLNRPRGSTRSGAPARLTTAFRREAFAANVEAAAQSQRDRRGYLRQVVALDVVLVGTAVALGYVFRFRGGDPHTDVPYLVVCLGLAALWMLVLYWNRCYDDRALGYGAEEYRRVVGGTLKLAGGVAILSYLDGVNVARGFLGIAFLLGTALLPAGRWLVRRGLHRQRRRERGWSRRVLVVGDPSHVVELTNQLRQDWYAGYRVVGACLPDAIVVPSGRAGELTPTPQHLDGVPVVGSFRNILEAAAAVSADTVAITGSAELTGKRLRRLGWQMEGTGIDLVLAPSLTDVAGPRIHTRPIAGLPLIHVSSPEFRGRRKWIKGLFDRTAAGLGLLLLAPLFLVIALAIKLDDPGPALFRQRRVGLGGEEFEVFKFRSMVVNAEALVTRLAAHSEGNGLLFKMRSDPRVTRVGALLRKWSLDELPQLINVLRGEMSLVGPRPPLPTEVAWYDPDIARRLLVKPGITGLWQVSGRSDLTLDESIRLDLYYVENWSLAVDVTILWKTLGAVVSQRGAY
ncbi:MAG TPA: sugar transferase [Micromonosporaceae bacterium]|jgi:exopolysaccharide biosynthesis polyprenyl glycosylphosphotransferase